MYIRILNYLISKLEKLRDKAKGIPKSLTSKEWVKQFREWKDKKSYK